MMRKLLHDQTNFRIFALVYLMVIVNFAHGVLTKIVVYAFSLQMEHLLPENECTHKNWSTPIYPGKKSCKREKKNEKI